MSKHTPGPWTFYDDTASTGRIEIVALGKTVARIYRSVPEEDLPNARLIAAAPDLLEAAIEFVRKVECGEGRSTKSYAQFKAAIAKATGEQA